MNVECWDERRCTIGEGPHYDETTGRVYWIDIPGGRVLWRSLDTGHGSNPPEVETPEVGTLDVGAFEVGATIGAAVPTTDGELVLCLPDRLEARSSSGVRRTIASYPPRDSGPPLRSNDAKADRRGRLWHGTMAYDSTPGLGALYRLDPGATSPIRVIDATDVANGLGWSPDGSTMYFADSPTRRIDAFDYDQDTGTPSRRRPFAVVDDGLPDGLCVDADGGVWVAVWGGSVVRRFAPDGTCDRTLAMPTPLVTSCAFVGPRFDLLVVTTAAEGHEDDPAAGLTYLHRPGDVTGLPCDRYRPQPV